MITNKKIYKIDDEPVTPRELIRRACEIDERYANDWLKQTSSAAKILRENGYNVEENK